MSFSSVADSYNHSLETLEQIAKYDDFMLSIKTLADMGCGKGEELKWWATRTDPETNEPLKIDCTGFDREPSLSVAQSYSNIVYQKQNFENEIKGEKKFDVIWCHDAFQYALNPINTLKNWYHAMNENGMLVIIMPTTINLNGKKLEKFHHNHTFYHYSLVNLMYMLAMNGFDCGDGFLKDDEMNGWIMAAVYKSDHEPEDPLTASWHTMADRGLLPGTALESINNYNYVRQDALTLPWVNKELYWYGR